MSNNARKAAAECVYDTVPGWEEDLRGITDFNDLPTNAQNYVALIEKLTGKPVTIIGVGPKRSQTIFR